MVVDEVKVEMMNLPEVESLVAMNEAVIVDENRDLDSPTGTNQISRKRRLLKRAPDAPKRFRSSFIFFVQERINETKQTLPSTFTVTCLQ